MASIDLFKPDPLTSFANRLKKDLGLQVRFRGKKIRTDYSMEPPAVVLPNMERAREEDLEVLMGLCLLEAARCRFSDIEASENIKDYPTKYVFTALLDEYVMRAIEPHWEGGRALIVKGMTMGREWLESEMRNDLFRNKSFIKATHLVQDIMECERDRFQIAFDPSDEAQVLDVAENMEARRVSLLWLDEKLGLDIIQSPFLLEWPKHPWKAVFDEITESPAKSAKECVGQAIRIVEKLGINPQPLRRPVALQKKIKCPLADFLRPVDEARELVKVAEEKQQEALEAQEEASKKQSEIDGMVRDRAEQTPEYDAMDEAQEAVETADDEVKRLRDRLRKRRERLKSTKGDEKDAKRRHKKINKGWKAAKKRAAALKKEFKAFVPNKVDADEHGPDLSGELRNKATFVASLKTVFVVLKRLRRAKGAYDKRQAKTAEVDKVVTEHTEQYNAAKATKDKAVSKMGEASGTYREAEEKVREGVMKVVGHELEALREKEQTANNAARYATTKANEVLHYIKKRDEDVEAPLAPGATEKLVEASFENYKGQETADELKGAIDPEDLNADIDDKFSCKDDVPPRKYVPFTREYDSVEEVEETAEGRIGYEDARDKMEDEIEKAKNSLKRLYSPYKTSIKINARQGRFDPRKAVRVVLSGRGVNVDVSKVFREIKTHRTPKVAVTLLLDCSRSMDRVEGVSLRSMLDADSVELLVPLHEEEPENYTFKEMECGACVWRKVRKNSEAYFAKTIELEGFVGKGKTVKDALYNLQARLSESEHTRRRLLQESAVALAEVMKELNIPYEVLGHTTRTDIVPALDFDGESPADNTTFSRYAPFRGLIFKSFGSSGAPTSVFTKVEAQDNLDGEGVLWAASRLCQKSERTKILIVLSDGYPSAKFSHEGELQRHLYGVCKLLETHEPKGMFLWGLGTKTDQTKEYFKNANVIQKSSELPEAVLGIVEHVLVKIKGSMA